MTERKRQEERRKLLEKYQKDQTKFKQELDSLNHVLNSESFDIADMQAMCNKT